jgi:hypothetical protein
VRETIRALRHLKPDHAHETVSEGVGSPPIRSEQYDDLKYGYQMYGMALPFPLAARTEDLRLAGLFTQGHHQPYTN